MNYWDEDIDLLVGKKSAAKQGRRSNKNSTELVENSDIPTRTAEEIPFESMKTRKTGVWSDDPPKSSRSGTGANIIELERFQNEKVNESNDDIPVIPDIEDIQDDPLNLPDVKPLVSVDKSTYKELDNHFDTFQSGQVSFGNLGDVDLSYLTNRLYPEKEVQPCSEIWTMESLFNDLSRSNM